MYKIAYCREKWSMLKYESEQCLEGTALSEGLRVVVLRWQCPERLLRQCTRLGKLTRLLKDVGTDHLSEDSCLQIVHSKRVGMWFLTDFLQKGTSRLCARRGITEHGAWLDWWDRNMLEGGCIDWKELVLVSQKELHKKDNLQKSLLQSLLKELCRSCLSRSSLEAGQRNDLYIQWVFKHWPDRVIFWSSTCLVEALEGPFLDSSRVKF